MHMLTESLRTEHSKMPRMKALISQLTAANHAYYQEDKEIISNLEYDALYDELVMLEAELSIVLTGSPTRKVGYDIVGTLKKAEHTTPMLSLDKTKSPDALADFLGEHIGLLSWKLDGLTIILRYNHGELQQALTRGNGRTGEDVTHNAKVFCNVPLTVPYKGAFDLRGEAVIPYADFETINANLPIGEEKYKNPRNLCSGAVRQLNSEVAASRRVFFYAFGVLGASEAIDNPTHEIYSAEQNAPALPSGNTFTKKSEQLAWLASLGFDIIDFQSVTMENVAQAVEQFKERTATAPLATDGLVLTFDDIAYSESLGATSKFPKDSIAFKWADELVETVLTAIEWNTSRTGLINPVAIFEPVDIEGSQVGRASLHNVSILQGLKLCIGDRITVYKANMIIPQVAENLSAAERNVHSADTEVEIPTHCLVCGGATEIIGDPEALYCTNPNCDAQQIRALSHFVSRDAMNISGLSEQTLEKFIALDIVRDYTDLFELSQHESAILATEGFAQKSYEKLLAAIDTAKNIALPNFIYALGILHVGLANAKLLCIHFRYDPAKILSACTDENYMEILSEIKGYGEAIAHSLHTYFSQEKNVHLFNKALGYMNIQPAPAIPEAGERVLDSLTFVITGDLAKFENRKALQTFIETNGGKVTGSVTAKTTFLINNDAASTSSKNKKATQLGVAILTEEDFMQRFFESH